MTLLNTLLDLINHNPFIVMSVFILSLLANIMQVSTYFRDKSTLKKEQGERQRLAKLVDTYESVLEIAKDVAEDKVKLNAVKDEILTSSSRANELREKVSLLQNVAQQKLVSQAIEYNLGVLEQSYAEVTRLREQYKTLDNLPDIPKENKRAIEDEVQIAIQKPYTLPREFIFTSALLVLFTFLMPSPANGLLLPFLVRFFILAFFEAVSLYPNIKFKQIVVKYHALLIFLAELGVWTGFVSSIVGYLNLIFAGFINFIPVLVSSAIDQLKFDGLSSSLLANVSSLIAITIFSGLPSLIGFILALQNWRSMKTEIEEKSLELWCN